MNSSRSALQRATILLFACTLVSVAANAQPLPAPEVYGRVAIGQIYLDEAFPDHSGIGGGARVFFTEKFALQGEFLTFNSNVAYLPNEHRWDAYVGVFRTWGPNTGAVRPYWLLGV